MDAVSGWNRRDFVGGAILLALAVGIPAAAVRLSDLDGQDAPGERQMALLREVCQLVIPRTGTPGAGDIGAQGFVALALVHGLEGTLQPVDGLSKLDYLDWLERTLDRQSGGDFLRLPEGRRVEVLTALDAEGFAPDAGAHPWRKLKALILTAYYTAETGAAEELRYELVPGRWDPVVPLQPGDRAWSSDWAAVDYG